MRRNQHIAKLSSKYLFQDVRARVQEFLKKSPSVKVISLGIGDTTEPLPPYISGKLSDASLQLGTKAGYMGYGPEQGHLSLREKIAATFYRGLVHPDEVFISDGTKCDIGRLQTLFGGNISVALQDPVYPVYKDGSVLQGIQQIQLMPCSPDRNFFPDLEKSGHADLLYFCSPNNPTGTCATRKELEQLVSFAKKKRSIILFDAAYSHYIQDEELPRSIFEIEGAREVAVELNSFSKLCGFTGVRLGWTVVPHELQYDDGSSVWADWNRLTSTIFNGASCIAQHGGVAVLDQEGMVETKKLIRFYLENAAIIKKSLVKMGCEVFGGDNAPYLWARFQGKLSWQLFDEFLEKFQIITTPGSGFGAAGEGFLRFTAFGRRDQIEEAARRMAVRGVEES